mmetsp:Transcript_66297/g.115346  ORF Transcript_66297/g.115346 Transcript_66297/m.115346 type:complete len:387 (-) Transcript_66297:45-1205(-)
MISSQVVSGPKQGDAPVVGGTTVQWTLVNDGTVAWPEGTSLRLVGGPLLTTPYMDIPSVAPFHTVIVDLEVIEATETEAQLFYSLATPESHPFGEIMALTVVPREKPALEKPSCMVIVSPMDGKEEGIEALQGELKTVEFVLANVGKVAWPEDATATLFYNTPGFAHLPTKVELPTLEPNMTAIAQLEILIPEQAGAFQAMWAVTSPTYPEFGDILTVHFKVDDFPFMDWMLADGMLCDTFSEPSSTSEIEQQSSTSKGEPPVLSMAVAMQNHLMPSSGLVTYNEEENEGLVSLGNVSGLSCDTPWNLDLIITNNGNLAWPTGTEFKCCFGDGFGCTSLPVEGEVQVGESVNLCMELRAPSQAAQAVWALANADVCFGPLLTLNFQ